MSLMTRRRMMGVKESGDDIDIPIGVNFIEAVEIKTGWYDQRNKDRYIGATENTIWDNAKALVRYVTKAMPYDTKASFEAVGLVTVGNVLACFFLDKNKICVGSCGDSSVTISQIQADAISIEQENGVKIKYVMCTFEGENLVWMRTA